MTSMNKMFRCVGVLVLLGSVICEKRNHHQIPAWIQHCWDNAETHLMDPFCAPYLACEEPPKVAHGQIINPEPFYKSGDNVTYVCDPGYHIVGSDVIQCQKGEDLQTLWTKPPTCQPVCGDLPIIDNGNFTEPDNHYPGTIVMYSCNHGYKLGNVTLVICLDTGLWSPQPECNIFNCSSPPQIAHGNLTNSPDMTIGSEAIYECLPGYGLKDGNSTMCIFGGIWQTPFPQCVFVQCPPIPEISDGHEIDQPNTTIGSVAVYECNPGFALIGTNSTECLPEGIWRTPLPGCVSVQCPPVPMIANGHVVSQLDFSIGAEVIYECNSGFSLKDINSTECLPGRTWKTPLPECISANCSEAPSIPQALLVNTPNQTVGSVAIYQCSTSLFFESTNSTECLPGGVWKTPLPKCVTVGVHCTNPPQALNAQPVLTLPAYSVGDVITYTCKDSYVLNGVNDNVTCLSDGSWSQPPACIALGCYEKPVDLVFILDGSSSMGLFGFEDTLNFVKNMIDIVPLSTTRFGLMTFSNTPNKVFYLDELVGMSREDIKNKVNETVFPAGDTYTHLALEMARTDFFTEQHGMRQNSSKVAIVVTDGQSNNETLTSQSAETLKNSEVTVYAVGIGSLVSEVELRAIASDQSKVYRVPTTSDIIALAQDLIDKECNATKTIDPCQAICDKDVNRVCGSNGIVYMNLCEFKNAECLEPDLYVTEMATCEKHCGAPPVVANGYIVSNGGNNIDDIVTYNCTSGYNLLTDFDSVTCQINGQWTSMPYCGKGCVKKPVDIVFMLDASGSVGIDDFGRTLAFVRQMASAYSPEDARFGLLTFSSEAYLEFYLNAYINDTVGLNNAIQGTSYRAGSTQTYAALNFTRTQMFTEEHGMRPNVSHVAIVVTDGHSDDQSKTVTQANLLKADGVTIYTIGVGDASVGGMELTQIASKPSYVFTQPDYKSLQRVGGPLQDAISCEV